MMGVWKYTAAVALTGAVALASATPSEARNGRNAAAIGAFAAGAIVGAAAASAANGGGYYYGEPGYAYGPDYGYVPAPAYRSGPGYYAYDSGYAYAPAPSCWVSTNDTRGYGYRGSCATNNVDTDAARGQARPNVSIIR